MLGARLFFVRTFSQWNPVLYVFLRLRSRAEKAKPPNATKMLRASDLESGLFPFWPSALSAFLGLYGQTLRYVSLRGLVPAGPHGCLGCGVVLGSGSMSLVSFARRAKRGEEPQARPSEFTESASACWGVLKLRIAMRSAIRSEQF